MKKIIFFSVVVFLGSFGFSVAAQTKKCLCSPSSGSGDSFTLWTGATNCDSCTDANCGSGYTHNCGDDDSSGSNSNSSGSTSISFPNPIGYNNITDFLNGILGNLVGLIGILAVVFIVIGGVMYIISGGSEEMTTMAKKTWTAAVIGLAISLAAPTFLKTIQGILGGSSGTGSTASSWVSSAPDATTVATNVLNFLLSIFGILAIIALVIGGGMYLTAYGDDKRIDSAKDIIKYAIIGIVVALAAVVIVRQVGTFFNIS